MEIENLKNRIADVKREAEQLSSKFNNAKKEEIIIVEKISKEKLAVAEIEVSLQ